MWRVYGFCAAHTPPSEADALVYRVGRPRTLDYDLPLGPVWSPVYLLLGTLGFGIWCAGMWRYARPGMPNGRRIGFLLLHAVVIAGLFLAG